MKTNKRGFNTSTLKAIGACFMSAAVATSMFAAPVYAQDMQTASDYSEVQKTETVYATLNNDGSLSSTIVSSWLHDDQGIHNIKEDLDLKNVENIKTDEEPSVSGKTYTWNAAGNDVYYQGDSTKQLPVSVSIRYELDGQPISAKNIQGKNGHVKISIHYKNNQSEVISSGGKNIIVHPGYLAGGILKLDTGDYTNVTCDQGKVVSDGTNEILAFVSVPGLEDTLNSAGLSRLSDRLQAGDTCTIEADAQNFDLGNLLIGISSDFDLNDLTQIQSLPDLAGSVNEMVDASAQLQQGAEKLAQGTSSLKTSAAPLTRAGSSVNELGNALVTLNTGSRTLKNGVDQYTNGVDLLAAGSKQLYGITDGIAQIQAGVSQSTPTQTSLVQGANQLNQGLQQLDQQVSTIDANKLNTLSQQLTTSKKQLQGMQTMIGNDQQTLTKLQSGLASAQTTLSGLTTAEEQIHALATDIITQIKTDQGIIDGDNKKIAEEVEAINAKIDVANSQIDSVNKQIEQINSAANHVNDQIASAQTNIDSAYSSAQSQLDSAIASAKNEAASQAADEKEKAAIQGAAISASIGSAPTLSTVKMDTVQSIKQINHISAEDLNLKSLDNVEQINADCQKLSGIFGRLNTTMKQMNDSIDASKSALLSLSEDVNTSISGIENMQQMIIEANTSLGSTDYVTLIKKLKAASAQLSAGSSKLVDGVDELNQGLEKLQTKSKEGIDKANAGAKKLSSNSDALRSGSNQLSDGTSLLAGRKGQLDSMASGLDQLGSAFDQLNDGANQLADGEAQFNTQAMAPLKKLADLTGSEVQILTDSMNAIQRMTKENSHFAGAPEGAQTKVNYILRTGE